VVSKEVFRLEKTDGNTISLKFSDTKWENTGIV
jgi:hypothetical protein